MLRLTPKCHSIDLYAHRGYPASTRRPLNSKKEGPNIYSLLTSSVPHSAEYKGRTAGMNLRGPRAVFTDSQDKNACRLIMAGQPAIDRLQPEHGSGR